MTLSGVLNNILLCNSAQYWLVKAYISLNSQMFSYIYLWYSNFTVMELGHGRSKIYRASTWVFKYLEELHDK